MTTPADAPIETATLRCDLCGRTGIGGFRVYPAGPVFMASLGRDVDLPGFTECTGKVACRRRQWRGMSPERRARIRSGEDL